MTWQHEMKNAMVGWNRAGSSRLPGRSDRFLNQMIRYFERCGNKSWVVEKLLPFLLRSDCSKIGETEFSVCPLVRIIFLRSQLSTHRIPVSYLFYHCYSNSHSWIIYTVNLLRSSSTDMNAMLLVVMIMIMISH